MIALVQALPLAVALTRLAVPEGVRVEAGRAPDSPWSLPMVVVGTSAPVSASRGPNEASAQFSIALRCYADDRQQALDICVAAYGGLNRLWRARTMTPYGWLSHISTSSLQPSLVASDMEADDVYRFDTILQVTARNRA